jgi:hypothetical protein
MPIEVLIGAATSPQPEVAILESKNPFRTNRWGIPEYMRACAEIVHAAREKTYDLSFKKVNDLTLELTRRGKIGMENASALALRLIFNFGVTEQSEIGFKQAMNLISLDGLAPASYVGFVTSEQLAGQVIRLGEVDKATKRITRQWDVDLRGAVVSALVNRALGVIPERGLIKIQTDSLEDLLSNTHRSYSPDSDERIRIKQRIRSGQEDNIYIILRYEVFGANTDIWGVWPTWLNGDIWSDLPVWLRVNFFQSLIEKLKARGKPAGAS